MLRPVLRPVLCLALLACTACSAPRQEPLVHAAKPGWGRTFRIERAVMEVRVVPASLAPSRPELRTGKPGWGRVPR